MQDRKFGLLRICIVVPLSKISVLDKVPLELDFVTGIPILLTFGGLTAFIRSISAKGKVIWPRIKLSQYK